MIILKIMGIVFIICGFLLICCLIGTKLTGEYNWEYGKLEGLYDFFKSVNTCQDCGKFLAIQNEFGVYIPAEKGAEVHHILPVSQGGTDNPNNLITLCKDCHKLRHKKLKELNGNK